LQRADRWPEAAGVSVAVHGLLLLVPMAVGGLVDRASSTDAQVVEVLLVDADDPILAAAELDPQGAREAAPTEQQIVQEVPPEVTPERRDPVAAEPEPDPIEDEAPDDAYVRVTASDGSTTPDTQRIGRFDREVDRQTRAPVATTRIGQLQVGERPTPLVKGGPGEQEHEVQDVLWKPVAARIAPDDEPVVRPDDGSDAVAMAEPEPEQGTDAHHYPVLKPQQAARPPDGASREEAEVIAAHASDAPDEPVSQPAQPVREAVADQVLLPLFGVMAGGSVQAALPERPDDSGSDRASVPEGPEATWLAAASGGQDDELRLAQTPADWGNARAGAEPTASGPRSTAVDGRAGGATDGSTDRSELLEGAQARGADREGQDALDLGTSSRVTEAATAHDRQQPRQASGGAAGTTPRDLAHEDPVNKGQSPTDGVMALTGLPRTAPALVGSESLPLSETSSVDVRADDLAVYWDEVDDLMRDAMSVEMLPLEARALGLHGTVGVHFVLNARGQVTSSEVTRESGNPDLDRWTLDALPDRFPRPPKDAPTPLHVRWDRRVWDHWATGNEG